MHGFTHPNHLHFQLTPQLLKASLITYLNSLLDPIRAEFDASPAWQAVTEKAYPAEKKAEKVKKVKNLGDPAKLAAAREAAAARKAQGGGAGNSSSVVAKPDGHVEGRDAEKVSLDAGGSAEDTLRKLHIDGE